MNSPILTPKHYQELKASGISDAIIEKYFYSIEGQAAQEWLIEDALSKLNGDSSQYVTEPVKRLLNQSEHVRAGSWVCAANGQLKPNEPRTEQAYSEAFGQYVDVLRDGSPKLIKYESIREKPYQGKHVSLILPAGEARKSLSGNRLIIIVEGSKKAAAAATLGYEAIALPGVDMGAYKVSGEHADKKVLIPVLQKLVNEGASFIVAYDQDSKLATRKGVARSAIRLGELLSGEGPVKVAQWPNKAGKGLDDVLVDKGADYVHDVIEKAVDFDEWRESLPKSWLRTKKKHDAIHQMKLERIETMHAGFLARPRADVILNQRYLDKGTLPAPGSVALNDSPMSTGKTSSYLAGVVEQHRREYPNASIISSAYRNILLRQSGLALGIVHWLDTDGDPSLEKFKALAACPESLPKLAGQKIPANSLLIIDEVVAELRHAFCSDTMKNGADRVAVIRAVQTLFEKVLDGGGFIVGLEAGIPQWAIDCLKELLPSGTPVRLTRNEFKMQANEKAFIYKNLTHFKSEQQLAVSKGLKICAASDSANQIDGQYRQMFKSPKDFHISAQNSSELEAQAFAENPQVELIRRGGVRFLSYSPTIGAGVSIDDVEGEEPWFDAISGVFSHLPSYDAAQQLKRYRRNVPLHIFCNEKGIGVGGSDLDIFDPEKLAKRWDDALDYGCSLTDAVEYLSQGSDQTAKQILRRSLDGEIEEIALINEWRSIATAVDNFDKLHLKENLQAKLKSQGYEIIEIEEGATPEKTAEFKDLKEQADADAGKEFAGIEVPGAMTPDEARDILSTHGHSRQESLAARKCLYQFEFPSCDFNDVKFCETWLIKSKGKKLSQLRTEWAARNPKSAKSLDRWHLKGKLKQAQNLATGISAADVAQIAPGADLFARAGLPSAIDAIGNEAYGGDHPEVVKVVEWVNANQKPLKRVFRMRFEGERSNLDIFNGFARKLGYSPQKEKRAGKDGQRENLYTLNDFDNPDRAHMLRSLTEKFEAKLEQKGEGAEGRTIKPSTDWGANSAELERRQLEVFEPQLTKNASEEWIAFEVKLIDAQTYSELQAAKAETHEDIRRAVMKVWENDLRYQWLGSKAARLEAELQKTQDAFEQKEIAS